MEEILKSYQNAAVNNPVPVRPNNLINRFENNLQNMYPLGDILNESKKRITKFIQRI